MLPFLVLSLQNLTFSRSHFPTECRFLQPLLYHDTFKAFILKKKSIQVAFEIFCSVYVNFHLSVFNRSPAITGVRQVAEKRGISKDTELEQFKV